MKLKKLNLDISSMSKTQKLGLLIILLAILGGFLAFKILSFVGEGDPEEEETHMVEIQDADMREPEQSKIRAYRNNEALWEKAEEEDLYAKEDEAAGGRRNRVTEDDMLSEMTSQGGSRTAERRSSGGSSSTGRRRGGEPRPGDPDYREYRMRQYYENTDAAVRTGEAQKDSISRAAAAAARGEQPAAPHGQPMAVIGDDAPVRRTSAMSSLDDTQGGGFSSLADDDRTVPTDAQYPFECMFVRETKIRDGSRVSVRLLEDMVVGSTLIPRNTHLMAMCSISQRLELSITSVEMNSHIYALGYEAYDTDGAKGIYCPDIGGDTRQRVQSRGLSSIGRIIGGRMGRLASEAVQTGVSVAQTRTGEVTVTVPAGYRFFIVKQQR